jgi:hypothetical protein
MDFDDDSWTFHLHGPGGISVYGDTGHQHGAGGCHHCCNPDVTATRANGRLSLVLHRNNSSDECWVGTWRLMVAYRARRLDAMLMPEIGELIVPVMAGPPRGPRYSRLLVSPKARTAVRSIHTRPAHPLDARPVSTSRDDQEACNVTVNIYAHTRLRLTLLPKASLGAEGAAIGIALQDGVLQGSVAVTDSFARLFAPTVDLAALVAKLRKKDIPREARIEQSEAPYDVAKLLAYLEKRDRKLARVRDEQVKVVSHEGSPLHMHIEKTGVAGTYHVGMYVEGTYCPDHGPQGRDGGHDHGSHGAPAHAEGGMPSGCHPGCKPQPFTRILTASVAVVSKAAKAARTVTTKAAKKTKRR